VVLFDNPAGLVNLDGCGLVDVGVDLLFPVLAYDEPPAGTFACDGDPYPCGQLSLVRKSCDGRWAVGLGAFAPAAFGARYHLEGPFPFDGPRFYKSFGALGEILPAVAYRASDRLSVGATLGVGVSHVELEGPHTLQSLPLRGTPTMIDLQTTGAALAWSVGLQYELTPATTVGLTYQGETAFRLDGNIRVETIPLGESYYDADLRITWPRSLGLGVRHELCPHRIVAADVIWFDWTHSFDSLDLHLSDPTSLVYQIALGDSLDESLPLDWRDTVSVRVGYEQHFGGNRVARVGYTYHRNPVPAGTLTPFLQTILEHTFTIGYGWTRGDLELDLAYQYTFGPDVEVAASDLAGGDFDNSHHEAQAHVLLVTLLKRL
jgi:long-chain fatty acid transport protein